MSDLRREEQSFCERSPMNRPAADGHRNLLLTMAMDLSARTGEPVKLPVSPAQLAMS